MKLKSIIQTTVFLCLICFSIKSQAQTNIVKGRLFALPGDFKAFSIGIGYEKLLSSNKSIQILYNRTGYDMRATDGSSEIFNSIIPEYRIYLGKHLGQDFNKCSFIGIFNEFTFSKLLPSGNIVGENVKFLKEKNKQIISPGMLIGKNLRVSKNCFFDVFVGIKYRLINQESVFIENQNEIVEDANFDKVGIRLGFNLGYRF